MDVPGQLATEVSPRTVTDNEKHLANYKVVLMMADATDEVVILGIIKHAPRHLLMHLDDHIDSLIVVHVEQVLTQGARRGLTVKVVAQFESLTRLAERGEDRCWPCRR